jgi:hypothetical protein
LRLGRTRPSKHVGARLSGAFGHGLAELVDRKDRRRHRARYELHLSPPIDKENLYKLAYERLGNEFGFMNEFGFILEWL